MSKVPGHDGLLRFDWINDEHWIHCYMLIALIKYKRLESLVVERAKMDARWRAFLMGTHTWAGRNSPIRRGSRITWIQLKMIRGHMGFENLQVFWNIFNYLIKRLNGNWLSSNYDVFVSWGKGLKRLKKCIQPYFFCPLRAITLKEKTLFHYSQEVFSWFGRSGCFWRESILKIPSSFR